MLIYQAFFQHHICPLKSCTQVRGKWIKTPSSAIEIYNCVYSAFQVDVLVKYMRQVRLYGVKGPPKAG